MNIGLVFTDFFKDINIIRTFIINIISFSTCSVGEEFEFILDFNDNFGVGYHSTKSNSWWCNSNRRRGGQFQVDDIRGFLLIVRIESLGLECNIAWFSDRRGWEWDRIGTETNLFTCSQITFILSGACLHRGRRDDRTTVSTPSITLYHKSVGECDITDDTGTVPLKRVKALLIIILIVGEGISTLVGNDILGWRGRWRGRFDLFKCRSTFSNKNNFSSCRISFYFWNTFNFCVVINRNFFKENNTTIIGKFNKNIIKICSFCTTEVISRENGMINFYCFINWWSIGISRFNFNFSGTTASDRHTHLDNSINHFNWTNKAITTIIVIHVVNNGA